MPRYMISLLSLFKWTLNWNILSLYYWQNAKPNWGPNNIRYINDHITLCAVVNVMQLMSLFSLLAFLPPWGEPRAWMMESKDQPCFQVQPHPIISYLFFLIPHQSPGSNPASMFSAYKAALCLCDWACPGTVVPSHLHTHCTEALKIAERQNINNQKWVQVHELGTPLEAPHCVKGIRA